MSYNGITRWKRVPVSIGGRGRRGCNAWTRGRLRHRLSAMLRHAAGCGLPPQFETQEEEEEKEWATSLSPCLRADFDRPEIDIQRVYY